MTSWKQRGDTIVEVLIAMAVVSMIIGGAYASVNRSTIQTRTAQERGEALQLLQGQLERIKAADQATIFDLVNFFPFCISDSNVRVNFTANIPPSATNDTWTVYPATCVKTPQGGVSYRLAIVRTAATPNNFTLYARWDGLGNLKQEVRLEYRYYQ